MKKWKIIIKLLPVLGDFIQEVTHNTKQKGVEYWTNVILDLIRTIVTILISMGAIEKTTELLNILP